MTKSMSDTLLRIEHKLDVLVDYLHGMTNVPPAKMPVPLRGGKSEGRCPITGTQVSYSIDPETGAVVRVDGLLNGISSALPIPAPPTWKSRTRYSEDEEQDSDEG